MAPSSNAPVTSRKETASGAEIVERADGTRTVTEADGTVTTYDDKGQKFIESPDGSTTLVKPDGETIVTEADGDTFVAKLGDSDDAKTDAGEDDSSRAVSASAAPIPLVAGSAIAALGSAAWFAYRRYRGNQPSDGTGTDLDE